MADNTQPGNNGCYDDRGVTQSLSHLGVAHYKVQGTGFSLITISLSGGLFFKYDSNMRLPYLVGIFFYHLNVSQVLRHESAS